MITEQISRAVRAASFLLVLALNQHVFAQTTTVKTTTLTPPVSAADNLTATAPIATPASTTQSSNSQTPPNGVELEIGLVSRIGGPQISNYQTTSGTLSLTSLGRATPQLLTGLGFTCDTGGSTATTTTTTTNAKIESKTTTSADTSGFCNKPFTRHLGAFVSAQFGAGSNQTISGYALGVTYALNKNLRLLAGFSMTPVNQISPGFANAAAQYVTKNSSLFPGVNPSNLSSNAFGAFDGIQTTSTAPASGATPTSTIYYPGPVTEIHYRGGFVIGVAMPINVFNLLGGNNKSTSTN